jgi:multimeric flavodoxin WrbA
MRITTILGSPRKKGNTATTLACFEEHTGNQHTIERINVTGYTIKGCLGCWVCQRTPREPGCIQRDDGNMILEKLINSDLIVYASPVYVWGFTAQLKTLLDRQCSLVKYMEGGGEQLLDGKWAALLTTCAGSGESNADLIQQIFQREMDYLGCTVTGMYVLDKCGEPSELGERAMYIADKMMEDIPAESERDISIHSEL